MRAAHLETGVREGERPSAPNSALHAIEKRQEKKANFLSSWFLGSDDTKIGFKCRIVQDSASEASLQ